MGRVPVEITTLGVTAGTQVKTGTCVVSMVVLNAAAAASTVSLYDGTSAADQRRVYIQCPSTATEGFAGSPVWFRNGIFAVTTGVGSETQIGVE